MNDDSEIQSILIAMAKDNTKMLKVLNEINEQQLFICKQLINLNDEEKNRVYIKDINMSIGAMIEFMLKWVVASIPVALVLGLIYLLILIVLMFM